RRSMCARSRVGATPGSSCAARCSMPSAPSVVTIFSGAGPPAAPPGSAQRQPCNVPDRDRDMSEQGGEHEEPVMPGIGRSVILRGIGVGFALLGLAWARTFLGTLAAGGPASFEDWRAGAYALTYLLAGAGMVLRTRWAAGAAAAWGAVTLSQFFYPP